RAVALRAAPAPGGGRGWRLRPHLLDWRPPPSPGPARRLSRAAPVSAARGDDRGLALRLREKTTCAGRRRGARGRDLRVQKHRLRAAPGRAAPPVDDEAAALRAACRRLAARSRVP